MLDKDWAEGKDGACDVVEAIDVARFDFEPRKSIEERHNLLL
jgi:hypothetical protein